MTPEVYLTALAMVGAVVGSVATMTWKLRGHIDAVGDRVVASLEPRVAKLELLPERVAKLEVRISND